jgi:hypothetical protein
MQLREKLSYPRYRFFNEVLGISYDSGEKPITQEDLRECCTTIPEMISRFGRSQMPDYLKDDVDPDPSLLSGFNFAGIDWGTGDASKTVFSVGRYNKDTYEILYVRRFIDWEADPELAVVSCLKLLEKLHCNYVGVDWGFGFGLNSRIRDSFGPGKTLIYCHTEQRKKIKHDPQAGVFVLNRTMVLSDIFRLIKERQIKFLMPWEQLRDSGIAGDFLNVFKKETRTGRMTYDHPPGTTDDCLHSVCYSFLASQVRFPRRDLS